MSRPSNFKNPSVPLRVLVAGGGVAGLETLLALRHLAGERVALTLLTPEAEFVYRPMAVAEPFGRGNARRHGLEAIAGDLGVELVCGTLAEVDDDTRTVRTLAGARLTYDALVVAVGASSEPAFPHVITWTPESDEEVFGGLLRDIEEGYSKSVGFVIPFGVAWPLPAYELALMTAWEARGMGIDGLGVTVYTPESAPLEMFGAAASAGLLVDLAAAGVEVRTDARVTRDLDGHMLVEPAGAPLTVERIVALPRAIGPRLAGLDHDARGFIGCDAHGKVYNSATVWAAGDAIAFAIKQGGLAAQQADAAAEAIAARAGVDLEPQPFHPVLRGVLLTGRGQAWMRNADGHADTQRHALFWPPTKIAGRYLSPYLAERDEAQALGDVAHPSGQPVELDLMATA